MRHALIVTFSTALVGASGGAALGDTASTFATETATIQPDGPRQPPNGDNFFNIEGEENGDFASYGVVRFDVAAVKAEFDSIFGAGNWEVASVRLLLTQSNAGFTTDGEVEVYFSSDDSTDVKTTGSPLTWPFFEDNQPDLPVDFILEYTFIEVDDGHVDDLTVFDGNVGQSLADDIVNDSTVTIVLVDASPEVAATYRGQAGTKELIPPELVVEAVEVGSDGDVVADTVFAVNRGIEVSGDISEVGRSDNVDWCWQPDVLAATIVAPINIEVQGTTTQNSATEIRFNIEAAATHNGVVQRVELFNFAEGEYGDATNFISIPTSDRLFTITVGTLPDELIGPSGELRARLSYLRPQGVPPFWNVCIDRIFWQIDN